jgi:sarcosine oxidase subunit gamma
MADALTLSETTPCYGLLPKTIGTCTLTETGLGRLTSIAPYKQVAISDALKTAHGMVFPAPNRATGKDGARAIWFGRDMALLAGPAPDAALADHAALTDQSDAWTCVTLSGADAPAVLARLVPVDFSAAQFKQGHTARTQLGHMNASITRTGADSFLILVFRSMAATLVHDLVTAMESLAARH